VIGALTVAAMTLCPAAAELFDANAGGGGDGSLAAGARPFAAGEEGEALLSPQYVEWLQERADSYATDTADWFLDSYFRRCPVLVANLHGFDYTGGGYATAYEWWLGLDGLGLAHAGSTAPPPGALLFYGPTHSNSAGHVDTYLGDGRIISNDIGADASYQPGAVSIFSMADDPWSWAGWNAANYLGWAEPYFTSTPIVADRPDPFGPAPQPADDDAATPDDDAPLSDLPRPVDPFSPYGPVSIEGGANDLSGTDPDQAVPDEAPDSEAATGDAVVELGTIGLSMDY
jgi:hypothetical protein